MVKFRISCVVLLLFTFLPFLQAQNWEAHVLLHSGNEMDLSINKVEYWGFTLDDSRTVLFKVISDLTTKDTSLVNRILSVVENVDRKIKADEYILSFDNAKFQQFKKSNESTAIVKGASFALQYDYASNYRIQADFSFGALYPVVISPSISFGSTIHDSYGKHSVGIGVGIIQEFEQHRLLALLTMSDDVIEVENANSITLNPLALAIEEQFLAGENNKYMLVLGAYCNLNKIEYDGKIQRFGVKLGIGINLSNFSWVNHESN